MKRWLLAALLLGASVPVLAQSLSKALVVSSCNAAPPTGSGLNNLRMDTSGRVCAGGGTGGGNMTTPILLNTTASGNTTLYTCNVFGANCNTYPNRAAPFAIQGRLYGLRVHMPVAVTTNYFTFSINVNGVVQTSLSCSVGQGGVNLGTTTDCSDPNGSVEVHVGDMVGYQSTIPGGTPTLQTGTMALAVLFESENGQESIIGGASNTFLPTSQISYLGPSQPSVSNANEYQVSVPMPESGSIDHLNISLPSNIGAGASFQLTVLKNGAATNLTTICAGAGNNQCNDLTDSVTVAEGDTISLQICPSNTAGCPAGALPGSTTMAFTMRLIPGRLNHAVIFSGNPAVSSANNNTFSFSSGTNQFSLTEAAWQNISPSVSTMTLENLHIATCPGTSQDRTYTLRSNSVSRPPHVIIPASAVVCPTYATGQDDVDTYQVGVNELLNYMLNVVGGGANPTVKASMTATVP